MDIQTAKDIVPWIAIGMFTLWALWLSLVLAMKLVARVSRGQLRESWVNGVKNMTLVPIPRHAISARRHMACTFQGEILRSGERVKGMQWCDNRGREWFAPDADYSRKLGYRFECRMDGVKHGKPEDNQTGHALVQDY